MSRMCFACLSIAALLSTSLTLTAWAQDAEFVEPHGHFVVMPPHLRNDLALTPAAPLQTWNGSFTYGGTRYTYNMAPTVRSRPR